MVYHSLWFKGSSWDTTDIIAGSICNVDPWSTLYGQLGYIFAIWSILLLYCSTRLYCPYGIVHTVLTISFHTKWNPSKTSFITADLIPSDLSCNQPSARIVGGTTVKVFYLVDQWYNLYHINDLSCSGKFMEMVRTYAYSWWNLWSCYIEQPMGRHRLTFSGWFSDLQNL